MTQPARRPSPTVRRRKLGRQLNAAREAKGLTREQVAAEMKTDVRTLRRWESGETNIRERDLDQLCELLDIDKELRSDLLLLSNEGRQPGWWVSYKDAIRPTFKEFLGLEAEATEYAEYAHTFIPGLLQTRAYMEAVFTKAIPVLDEATIDKKVELRLKRQQEMLHRSSPARFVIDQGALMRQVGGAYTMREQLSSLMDVARNRFVTVQVVPYEAGAPPALSSFAVITLPDMPPVASVELDRGHLYEDEKGEPEQFIARFIALREAALPEPMSLRLIHKIMKESHNASPD